MRFFSPYESFISLDLSLDTISYYFSKKFRVTGNPICHEVIMLNSWIAKRNMNWSLVLKHSQPGKLNQYDVIERMVFSPIH
jgi:hypothetical protein